MKKNRIHACATALLTALCLFIAPLSITRPVTALAEPASVNFTQNPSGKYIRYNSELKVTYSASALNAFEGDIVYAALDGEPYPFTDENQYLIRDEQTVENGAVSVSLVVDRAGEHRVNIVIVSNAEDTIVAKYSSTFQAYISMVKFNSHGGSKVESIYILSPDMFAPEMPDAPVRDGYTFEGWYSEETGGEQVSEIVPTRTDVELHAHWKKVETPSSKTTTATSETTTKSTTTTTQAPSETTKAPSENTKAPSVTTQVPSTTTQAPSTTTEAPTTPNETAGTTAKVPVETSIEPSAQTINYGDKELGTPIFTGTWNASVSNGTWTQDANEVWHYSTSEQFRATWGYNVNPYARGGQNQADWFWFDSKGNMLTGWQYINGKWYYLNPTTNGALGACLIGPGTTPDGYEIDESGAWTGR